MTAELLAAFALALGLFAELIGLFQIARWTIGALLWLL